MTAHPERIEELEALAAYLQADCARTERNRDLWRSQCKHQAAALEAFRAETVQFKAQRDELLAALQEAENALADYIPTIERTGASLNYGHKVLRDVRAAIQKATNKDAAIGAHKEGD